MNKQPRNDNTKQPDAPRQKQYIQPRLLNLTSNNNSFGDEIHKPSNLETIVFHNINGIKVETNWAQIVVTMKELKVDMFGFAEINKSMDNYSKQKWTSIIQKQYYLSKTIHSESSVETISD
jgi:hypothetical protein